MLKSEHMTGLKTTALVLLIVGAIDSIRNLPAIALFGSSLIFFFIFAAVVFLMVWIIHRFGIKDIASETPLNILRVRFARGEITKKVFEEKKKDLV